MSSRGNGIPDGHVFHFGGTRTEVAFADSLEPDLLAGPSGGIVVFDGNTARLFGDGPVRLPAPTSEPRGIPRPGMLPRAVLDAGEENKRWDGVERVLGCCAEAGLGRDGTVVGVGGGVVCDIAAFAASIYMRGCGLVLAPTTLLAMVDAALGGKTGIDFHGFKNLVGTFHPATRVVLCVSAVTTLPRREYDSGLAEVAKTALIGDPRLWAALRDRQDAFQTRDLSLVRWAVERCLDVKGGLCELDPRETGQRALLNLGHTFGHGLESACGFRGWTHGEAVAWGIGRALVFGEAAGRTPAAHAREVRGLLRAYGYRLEAFGVEPEAILAAMGKDKKRRGGKLRIVLTRGVGDAEVLEAEERDVRAALEPGIGGTA